jgi:pyruvate dehydrogenase E1 component alpha subunit
MFSVPVSSQTLHAAGWAMGVKLDGLTTCAIVYFGDGATSQGDFHEACNFAGVFGAPVIFFCQNNGWAISVPLERQTAGEIYRKAEGYGFPGVRVDGNDVLAVYAVTKTAVERAHAGEGPTLIEAMTYRIGPHSTADDASRYRDDDEVAAWRARDPIDRFRRYLSDAHVADDAFVHECETDAARWVSEIRAKLISLEAPAASEIFDQVFTAPPRTLERQRDTWPADG